MPVFASLTGYSRYSQKGGGYDVGSAEGGERWPLTRLCMVTVVTTRLRAPGSSTQAHLSAQAFFTKSMKLTSPDVDEILRIRDSKQPDGCFSLRWTQFTFYVSKFPADLFSCIHIKFVLLFCFVNLYFLKLVLFKKERLKDILLVIGGDGTERNGTDRTSQLFI